MNRKVESSKVAKRNWGVSMQWKTRQLSIYLRGWINYFGIANQYQQTVGLDGWIR